MKKALILLGVLAIAVTPSCTKQDPQTSTPTTTAVFTLDGFDTGLFPTKGMAEAIGETLPASLELTIQNTTTGASYTTGTGEPIDIPVGTYHVTASTDPASTQNIVGTALYLTHAPRVRVDAQVAVTAGASTYPLTASYESAALAILSSETSAWTGATSSKQGFSVDAIESGAYRWTFITGDITGRTFTTTLTPAAGGKSKSYTICGSETALADHPSDGLLIAPGRWYILHPTDGAMQSGSFSLDFPLWTAGN